MFLLVGIKKKRGGGEQFKKINTLDKLKKKAFLLLLLLLLLNILKKKRKVGKKLRKSQISFSALKRKKNVELEKFSEARYLFIIYNSFRFFLIIKYIFMIFLNF